MSSEELASALVIIVAYLIVLIPQGCHLHTGGRTSGVQGVETLCSLT